MNCRTNPIAVGAILVAGLCCYQAQAGSVVSQFRIDRSLDVARVSADFPVGFCLLTNGERHYVAYYDHERRMTVASRTLDSDAWQSQMLPSKVGWDSHNYLTMAVDDDGQLHVSGNMHCVPLIYFRTDKPGDITTLAKRVMTGELENRVTYPRFLTGPQGELIFTYRDGGSGNGRRFYHRYDSEAGTWTRLLERPLLDGEGSRNAYPLGPVQGPDGRYHMVWVWRDTPDCATNHHLSYARSKDLVHWESAFGEPVDLPMKLAGNAVWIDPIPSGGGIINGCEKLFFDSADRPVITYHKADADGSMQVYAARPEGGRWACHVLTDWNTRVEFGGRGSMGFIGIRISGLTRAEPGILTMTYHHRDYGSGRLVVDEGALQPLDKQITVTAAYPAELNRIQSDFEGMQIQRAEDLGDSGNPRIRYVLQWETLGRNNDRPRKPPLPKPSMLRLITLGANE